MSNINKRKRERPKKVGNPPLNGNILSERNSLDNPEVGSEVKKSSAAFEGLRKIKNTL